MSREQSYLDGLHASLRRARLDLEVERAQRQAIQETLKGRKATTATKNRLEYTILIREMQLMNALGRGDKLQKELRAVLEVAIARGEQLQFDDADYRERLAKLQKEGGE